MKLPPLKKSLLLAAGIAALAFGITGIFLPVLPTTPFLLLASACFLRSSSRLHRWLMRHRVFGMYLTAYLEYRAVPGATKAGGLILLWISLIVSMALISSLPVRLLLAAVGAAVTVHIATLKTLSPQQRKEIGERVAGEKNRQLRPRKKAVEDNARLPAGQFKPGKRQP